MSELICIVCPRGCHLKVDENFKVSGNFCKRGELYAKNELTSPKRKVTSTVKVVNGNINRVSVITDSEIPKELIFDIMKEIQKTVVNAPLEINTVVIKNVLNLGVNVITTREVKKDK